MKNILVPLDSDPLPGFCNDEEMNSCDVFVIYFRIRVISYSKLSFELRLNLHPEKKRA